MLEMVSAHINSDYKKNKP